MIFFSIGLPSRFAELCDALTARLAEHCLGSVALGSFNSFEDIATAAIRSDAAYLVAASRQPVGLEISGSAKMQSAKKIEGNSKFSLTSKRDRLKCLSRKTGGFARKGKVLPTSGTSD